MTRAFPDLPALAELGDTLSVAFTQAELEQRVRPRGRRARLARLRPVVVAVAIFALLAASAAAATLLVLRGSVIPAPETSDLQPPMIVQPHTARLSGVTARDPDGKVVWTVRLARSQTGLVCVTAGELSGGRFGITGLDGRFRLLAPGFADGCGAAGAQRAAFIGARVFDSRKHENVRTVVDGYGGKDLRSVTVDSVTGSRPLHVSADGAFVSAFTGYPEDSGLRVRLRFAGGRTETHSFGRSSFVVPDPAGALRIETLQIGGAPNTLCVNMASARQVAPHTRAPLACGDIHGDYFFRARRMVQGTRGGAGFDTWQWRHASRTVVYGHADDRRVAHVTVTGAGRARRLKPALSGSFQAVFPATVDPHDLQIVFTFKNGAVERRAVQANLRPLPGRHR